MASVALKRKKSAESINQHGKRTAPDRRKDRPDSTSDRDWTPLKKLYDAFRQNDAKLIGPDGNSAPLPESLTQFVAELIARLNRGKAVTIVRSQATLTTLEAANMLGVSRQFLVNLVEKGEIAYHMVGTHRRIYAQHLLLYKAKRDQSRHKLLRDVAVAEADEGLYGRIPAPVDAP